MRNFGLKVGAISSGRFEARIRELVAGQYYAGAATEPMLRARAASAMNWRGWNGMSAASHRTTRSVAC